MDNPSCTDVNTGTCQRHNWKVNNNAPLSGYYIQIHVNKPFVLY